MMTSKPTAASVSLPHVSKLPEPKPPESKPSRKAPDLPDYPTFLNGEYTTLPNAKISVMDRGFIFGDGIYEVVPAYGGKPFRMDEHLARMARSLKELRIDNPYTAQEWKEITINLIALQTINTLAIDEKIPKTEQNTLIYFQITRGVAMRDHVMTQGISPTVFAFAQPMRMPSQEQRTDGVACVTADDFRWQKAHIKTVSLLAAVFARQISFDAGAVETVMFRGNILSEAAASNIWMVKNGKVFGPKLDQKVLEGIRYGLMEEICNAQNIPFELCDITRQEVRDADELLLTSATKEVLAITTLDNKPVQDGLPGAVYKKIYAAYQVAKASA
jgi:D-alanine transaminase